jgi:glutamate N-acetyltransferase/amino-acid N-acetyltransferase
VVFTQSNTAGPAVLWSRQVLSSQTVDKSATAMVVNAGNANVCTGAQGQLAVEAMASAVANKIGSIDDQQIFVSSTGVIGEQLKVDTLLKAIDNKIILNSNQNWLSLANAIGTTDTYPKLACGQCQIDGETINIAGVAKGSGMIEPNMATMLAYVFTDAKVDQASLQHALSNANSESFNCMTVDSDTSTSDTCLLFATGEGYATELIQSMPDFKNFQSVLSAVMIDLAQQVAKDGEGASKFITINVSGAATNESAKVVAKSIANSPLVKTAIAGEDANWGRIVMAVGKTDEPIVLDKLAISMGGVAIAAGDGPVADYQEAKVNKHLAGQNIVVDVDLGCESKGCATVWTCDLTHGYIEINADYRS